MINVLWAAESRLGGSGPPGTFRIVPENRLDSGEDMHMTALTWKGLNISVSLVYMPWNCFLVLIGIESENSTEL